MDPYPRTPEMIYGAKMKERLGQLGEVVEHFGSRAPDGLVERHLERMEILIGQTTMGAQRLEKAVQLRAIINVKGNWEPNIDYQLAAEKGIHVLSAAPAMAPAVAEWTLAAMLCLGRGIPEGSRLFQEGSEKYGIGGTRNSRSLVNANVGLIGFGNLGRCLVPMLSGFNCKIHAYDPWLEEAELSKYGVAKAGLEELLGQSEFITIFAGATTKNQGFLSRELLELIASPATVVVLASRAAVVDFDALVELGANGKLRLAVDVFPEEPVAKDSPWRGMSSILWSSHRAGADMSSYALMRSMVCEDTEAILAGGEPGKLQRAPLQASLYNSI